MDQAGVLVQMQTLLAKERVGPSHMVVFCKDTVSIGILLTISGLIRVFLFALIYRFTETVSLK